MNRLIFIPALLSASFFAAAQTPAPAPPPAQCCVDKNSDGSPMACCTDKKDCCKGTDHAPQS